MGSIDLTAVRLGAHGEGLSLAAMPGCRRSCFLEPVIHKNPFSGTLWASTIIPVRALFAARFNIMLASLALLYIFLFLAAAYKSATNITGLFAPYLSPGSQIYLSSDANFTGELIPRWSSWHPPSYIGAIKPATETDVREIVSHE